VAARAGRGGRANRAISFDCAGQAENVSEMSRDTFTTSLVSAAMICFGDRP
jgi:hypothetical protein